MQHISGSVGSQHDLGNGGPYIRSCIYAAVGCSNLLALHLGSFLSDDEARVILKAAPVGLKHLTLHTSLRMVAIPNWKRLINIVWLWLDIAATEQELKVKAVGLAALPRLQHLSVISRSDRYRSWGCDHMIISGLIFSSLHTLTFNTDPFFDAVDTSFCPVLNKLLLLNNLPGQAESLKFPEWSLQRPIESLGCWDWNFIFASHQHLHLRCSRLHAIVSQGQTCLPMGPLLKLPAAKWLQVDRLQPKDPSGGPPCLTLTGSRDDYEQLLLKLQFRFEAGVEVQVRLDGNQVANAISQSGHAMLCRCVQCHRQVPLVD